MLTRVTKKREIPLALSLWYSLWELALGKISCFIFYENIKILKEISVSSSNKG